MTTVNQDFDYKGCTFTYLADGNRKVLILENTRNLQAVWHSELGIWQMIFHAKDNTGIQTYEARWMFHVLSWLAERLMARFGCI